MIAAFALALVDYRIWSRGMLKRIELCRLSVPNEKDCKDKEVNKHRTRHL